MELTMDFLKGIFIGFAMAVPVGPIGIMCIRKTLTEGRLRGLIIGLWSRDSGFCSTVASPHLELQSFQYA